MKLLELYEDLFQYICRLNRAAKTPAQPDPARVRAEVKELLNEIERNASADVRLHKQVKELELSMIYFVDNVICTSRLKFAAQWAANRLARERNELAGDERFFDFLDRDLNTTSDEAEERLAVYYVCLGLGFTGMWQGKPEKIYSYQEQIFQRIHQYMDNDPKARINEEAYKFTDTRVLTEPAGNKIILVAVIFGFLSLTVLIVYFALYANAISELSGPVGKIIGQQNSAR
jgi:type IV/VI secretion system ImpK/VasF family protein